MKSGCLMDYSNVGAVCFDCAKEAGFTQKQKAVGVWTDECGICHQHKPCTSLLHDWMPPARVQCKNDPTRHCVDCEICAGESEA